MALTFPPRGAISGATGLPWISSIAGLFGLGCPTAVVRLIIPIIVDPVNAHAFRTRTHVRKEALEGSPPLADGDAPTAVTRIRGVPGIIDAPEHRHPGAPGRVIGAFARRSDRACRPLQCPLRLDLRSCLRRMLLALHRMRHARAVPTEVAGYAVPFLIDRGKLPTAAGTRLRLQRLKATPGPASLRLGDPLLGLC